MAFTQADLDKQDAAIASPIEEEHFADRGIRRRTIDDLIKAREYAATQKADADAAAAGTRRVRMLLLYGGGDGC